MTNNKFGWVPDPPDHRDRMFTSKTYLAELPPYLNLRQFMPPVYDQGDLGSCTAQAIAAAIQYMHTKRDVQSCIEPTRMKVFQPSEDPIPSRLFIYYNERVMEGTVESDAGAMIRDGIKSVNKQGVCSETCWPHDIQRFREKPHPECYEMAVGNQALVYEKLNQDLTALRSCLAMGLPWVFGFSVYDSFMTDEVSRTGIMVLPKYTERRQGGHAVIAVGYDDTNLVFIVRNSWGTDWGDGGYFYMPYSYAISNALCRDFWVIKEVE